MEVKPNFALKKAKWWYENFSSLEKGKFDEAQVRQSTNWKFGQFIKQKSFAESRKIPQKPAISKIFAISVAIFRAKNP